MTIISFMTEKEFKQSALDTVARLASQQASKSISNGNVADVGQQTLEYLEVIAHENELSIATINIYTDIITNENQQILTFFGK